ncbi:MAG: tRNA methyltransferase ppm2 [Caeruleum heppii]|nr:MAG: tRNA methyltransferase ppm2 [Caeruleum heppii]
MEKIKGPVSVRKHDPRDDLIMATNNSSIVSKRSVERLYHPHRPQYFRHFVKKPQRRSPLINRGYWLRMRVIEKAVQDFIVEPSPKRKIVLNLGSCQHVTFVDVDYEQLMRRKAQVLDQTLELRNLLSSIRQDHGRPGLLFRSDQYSAVACDLRDLESLEPILRAEFDLDQCQVLCVAEVSITYMDVEAADRVVRWAAKLPDARFCLLEQILPDGEKHPFAQQMVKHFDKLSTPLRTVHTYPTTMHQERRFLSAGWHTATARNLWDLWCDAEIVTSAERVQLHDVEPFDEWEELAMFAAHYFLLVASTSMIQSARRKEALMAETHRDVERIHADLEYRINPKGLGRRRYSALISSCEAFALQGGMGTASRLASCDSYARSDMSSDPPFRPPSLPSTARMCHTITPVTSTKSLLVGGRSSPTEAFSDCWLYDAERMAWHTAVPLPSPRYRHCAVKVSAGQVLVYGGKDGTGKILNEWLLWDAEIGWHAVSTCETGLAARFGACMVATGAESGILFGGMSSDGNVLDEIWEWSLSLTGVPTLSVTSRSVPSRKVAGSASMFGRFGAATCISPWGVCIFGGIISERLLRHDEEIVTDGGHSSTLRSLLSQDHHPRPLLIGISIHNDDQSITIVGGGAVCFSFGTHWNEGVWTMSPLGSPVRAFSLLPAPAQRFHDSLDSLQFSAPPSEQSYVSPIPRVHITSQADFDTLVRQGQPVILEGLNIGPCTEKWDFEYLKERIGAERPVVYHQATSENMNFLEKNFSYVTAGFGSFLDRVRNGETVYLRSLSSSKPAECPASIFEDFTAIAGDFYLPPQLQTAMSDCHSSPLRISGPVRMWLHYDVMANVLCQIRGSKRMILYPPADARHLQLPAGASSSMVNVFDGAGVHDTSLARTHPHEAWLHVGDVLFIPSLWLHAATPTDLTSIAVNVFFRTLTEGYAVGKDVYGNRDVQAYEKGRGDIGRIVQSFKRLPPLMRRFYLERLAAELQEQAQAAEP